MIPEGQGNLPDLNAFRIRPTAHEPDPYTTSVSSSRRVTFEGLPAPAADADVDRRGEPGIAGSCLEETDECLGSQPVQPKWAACMVMCNILPGLTHSAPVGPAGEA